MVKVSDKQTTLRQVRCLVERRRCMRICRDLYNESDSDEDDLDEELILMLRTIERQRYSVVRRIDPFTRSRFHHFLYEIKDTRFRKLFRMERRSFHRILFIRLG